MGALPFRLFVAAALGFIGYVGVMTVFALLHRYRVNDGPIPYSGFVIGAMVGWTWATRIAKNRGWTGKTDYGPPLIVEDRGTWTYIYARPNALPFRITLVSGALALAPAVAIGFLAVSSMSRPPIPLFVLIIVVALFALSALFKQFFAWFHNGRRNVQRHGFGVSPVGIILVDGTTIPHASIARVTVHNAWDSRFVVAAGSSVAVGVAQMGLETQRQIGRISYVVSVEHQGMQSVLAGGLDETLARATMQEITRRLPRSLV
jgi:hypothetical protein